MIRHNGVTTELWKPAWQAAIFHLTKEHRLMGGEPGPSRVMFVLDAFSRYANLSEDSLVWVEGMKYVVERWFASQVPPGDQIC